MTHDEITGKFQYGLLNGENPYQTPAEFFSINGDDTLSLSNFKQISGEPPCFTNLADLDCILQTLCVCSEAFKLRYKKVPYICIASKHGNPCGMAIDWDSPATAVNKAIFGNPCAVWGGEVITNFEINKVIANLLFKSRERERILGTSPWMLDIIVAPRLTEESIEILGKRRQRKLFENPALFMPSLRQAKWSYRFVRGGFLRQPPPNYILDLRKVESIGKKLNDKLLDSLIIAWAVAYSSNHGGNEIAIAKDSSLASCGGGPSTIEAVQSAIIKAKNSGHRLAGGVFAANAFFPFTDASELLVKAGLIVGLVPLGGKRIDEVKSFFKKNRIDMFYLPEKYRGFCRH